MMTRAEFFDRLLSAVFPKRCVLCDDVVEYDVLHCGCPALPLPEPRLRFGRFAAVSVFDYGGNIREAILRFKRDREPRAARFFAGEMAKVWKLRGGEKVDVILAVPAKNRAPDHATLLAEELSRLLALPLCDTALSRRESSMPQHSLDREGRERNARESYFAVEPFPLAGINILLADDILTTGATLSACAEALLEAGAASVSALTIARTAEARPQAL